MFIREIKTKNNKSGEIYIKHVLVESVRVNGLPRQRTIMGLGRLELHRREWKKLAHALEAQLSGQLSLLEDNDKYIDSLALSLVSNNKLSQKLSLPTNDVSDPNNQSGVSVILDSISTEKTRSLGPELVCQNTWDLLKFDQVLKECGLSQKQRAVAKVLVFGRLINPGSERHTINWFKKCSALSELGDCDILDLGKDSFYGIGDKLYRNKEKIEALLLHNQQSLFPGNGRRIFLYDLTNTYMEGSCLGNGLAARGHCKSKRYDCPLITLSLLIDNEGMPIASHIYKGNQGEPETMIDMLKRLESLFGYDGGQLVLEKPTVVMDRGIATEDNIALLSEHGYQYIVITREDCSPQYLEEFQTARDTFTPIDDLSHKYTAYGDESRVWVKKISTEEEKTCKVLCLSEGKAQKEIAISAKKDARYIADVQRLSQSIVRGSIKKIDKITVKLEKANAKHKSSAAKFTASILCDPSGKALGIEVTPNSSATNPLAGCYVIESTHLELDAEETWRLYMTQVNVEAAFRSMKGELGMRPVYHQKSHRSAAHLFITVLAYHILSAIQRRLAQHNDTRHWQTIREVLSTHTRSTVVMKDKQGNIYHHRCSGKPEDVHVEIYDKLGVSDTSNSVSSCFI
jgi:transposase